MNKFSVVAALGCMLAALFSRGFTQDGIITTDPGCVNAVLEDVCADVSNCRCASVDIPNNFSADSIPQIVLLSFDDAITLPLYEKYYIELFKNKVNPNGCPMKATFFIQHDYSNYSLIHELWRDGHEIASHSMTHRVPAGDWAEFTLEEITDEMVGVRRSAATFARIPEGDIVGVRVPYLQFNGNTYGEMMETYGFVWDASRPTRIQMDPGLWPYTYDFFYEEDLFLDCPVPPCMGQEGETFPGIWQIPINDLNDTLGNECAMLDQCSGRPENKEEALSLLRTNFNLHYNGNRSPFTLFTHASWFEGDWEHNFLALDEWLANDIMGLSDVYVLPVGKIIDYMRDPVTIDEVDFSTAFACETPKPRDCPVVNNCKYCEPPLNALAEGRVPSEIIMPVCGRCPFCFPTPGDPLGDICENDPMLEC